MLVDTNLRDTTTEIWGHKVSAPIGFAPIGMNAIYHHEAEKPVAKVAGELNLPYCLSTAGSTPIEQVGAANDNGGPGPRFFQLYMPHDDELALSLLNQAWKSGFDALIPTTDTWQLGWRHDDIANSNYAFYRGIGAALGLSDSFFQKRCRETGIDIEKDPVAASTLWIDSIWHVIPLGKIGLVAKTCAGLLLFESYHAFLDSCADLGLLENHFDLGCCKSDLSGSDDIESDLMTVNDSDDLAMDSLMNKKWMKR